MQNLVSLLSLLSEYPFFKEVINIYGSSLNTHDFLPTFIMLRINKLLKAANLNWKSSNRKTAIMFKLI
jgi:hypothetical protein